MFELTIAWLALSLWRALAHYYEESRLQVRFDAWCMP